MGDAVRSVEQICSEGICSCFCGSGVALWVWFIRCVSVVRWKDLWEIDQYHFGDQNRDVRVWLLCAVGACFAGDTCLV
ncbi:hypothetical protein [Xenorhabdus sp. NBAII XenSa04]|uniref:hypothetical protein n=1 Tax=Xenorhabdus sp. NBAII XenSa04 TaxID=1429873 RepID=UPI0012E00016